VSISKLAANADVGRSTFYEHFEGKHDLPGQSVARMLKAIADAPPSSNASDALLDLLTHVRAQHALASALLRGSTRPILIGVLALKLERQLASLARRSAAPPIAPLAFPALSLAQAHLGAIDAWLSSDDSCDVTDRCTGAARDNPRRRRRNVRTERLACAFTVFNSE